MGYTTRISDYEWDRGDGVKEVPEGVEVSSAAKLPRPDTEDKSVTKSKVVEAEDKPEPKKSTARTKAK